PTARGSARRARIARAARGPANKSRQRAAARFYRIVDPYISFSANGHALPARRGAQHAVSGACRSSVLSSQHASATHGSTRIRIDAGAEPRRFRLHPPSSRAGEHRARQRRCIDRGGLR
ncbi:hypothetical protein, partial [Burkholderia pseudomallei]|uniref:hypothetical protein n=1 Tax=Burkholderia pseudomallei TaxID=28450 RepID=UPI0021168AE3